MRLFLLINTRSGLWLNYPAGVHHHAVLLHLDAVLARQHRGGGGRRHLLLLLPALLLPRRLGGVPLVRLQNHLGESPKGP